MTVTLATLRTQVRQHADMESPSLFCSDSEINGYINNSAAELHDLLTLIYEDYYLTSTTFSLTAGSLGVYTLPADFYKLRGVDYQVTSATDIVSLPQFNFAEREKYQRLPALIGASYANLAYRISASTLIIVPTSAATGTFTLWYLTKYTTMSSDSDAISDLQGWHEYVVVDAAIKCKVKEEVDVSALMAQKGALLERIKRSAANRNASEPEVVADVRPSNDNLEWSRVG